MELDTRGKIKVTEKMTRKQICGYLKAMGISYWWNLQGLGSFRGLPDIEGFHKKKHFYIEVKAPKGVLSEHQKAFKEAAEEEGEIVIVAHSYEEFEEEWKKFTH